MSYFMSFFNLLFTSLPLLAVGTLDMDLPPALVAAHPRAYRAFKREHSYSIGVLVQWLLLATAQSAIVFWFTLYIFYDNDIDSNGFTHDLWGPGNASTMVVVILTNILMLADCSSISWVSVLSNVLGILAFFLFYLIFSAINWTSLAPEAFGVMHETYASPKLWLYTLLTVGAMFVPYWGWRAVRTLAPTYAMRLREAAELDAQQQARLERTRLKLSRLEGQRGAVAAVDFPEDAPAKPAKAPQYQPAALPAPALSTGATLSISVHAGPEAGRGAQPMLDGEGPAHADEENTWPF
jgi:magnesium-transporting ATPase (P-type)